MNTQKVLTWLSDPYNQILTITYATAVTQAIAAETGWRWMHVVANVLASLPGVSVKGLATAGTAKALPPKAAP